MKNVNKKALIATVVTLIIIGGIFTRMINNTKEYTFMVRTADELQFVVHQFFIL